MAKKVWFGVVLLGAASAVAGVLYANHHAEKLIAEYIEQSNQQYLQLAEQGDMPPVQMSYSSLSANVLTASYKIQDLHISLADSDDLFTVGQVELIGLKPNGLSDEGAALLKDLKLAPGILNSLPADLADYLSALLMELSYQYEFNAETGVLTFQQEFSIDQSFSLNYSFVFAGVTELWRFAENLQKLTPEQQQQQAEQPDYVSDVMKIVAGVGIATGSFEIQNKAFLQQLFDKLAQSQLSTDYAATQQQLSEALKQNPQVPDLIREPVLDFLKKPERLNMSFKLPQPLTFAQMQDGSAMEGIETAEDFITYSGFTLTANSDQL